MEGEGGDLKSVEKALKQQAKVEARKSMLVSIWRHFSSIRDYLSISNIFAI